MEFRTREELVAHYRAVDARVAAAARRPRPVRARPIVFDLLARNQEREAQAVAKAEATIVCIIAILRWHIAREIPGVRRSPRDIIVAIAVKHGIFVEDILGKKRHPTLDAVRKEAVLAVRSAYPPEEMSLPALGRVFRRNHTTIINALRGRKRYERKPPA